MRVLFSLLRVFQLDSIRRQNELQALAPGSMHPRVHVTTLTMTIGALLALAGFVIHPLLIPTGVVIFAVAFVVVVVQAIVAAIRSD